MISARVDATSAIARLDAMKQRLRAGVRAAVADGAARLTAMVQAKLSGEVLNVRSGTLRGSIGVETVEDGQGITARLFSDTAYARIQEYGGRIVVPALVPVNAKALAFAYGGRMVFAARTAAHAVDIPERSYMRASLAEFEPAFIDAIRKLAADARS